MAKRSTTSSRKAGGSNGTADPTYSPAALQRLLEGVKSGEVDIAAAIERLKSFPFEQIDCATIDHHRAIRKGFCEVIYCAGKTPQQVAAIAEKLGERGPRLLGTRATPEHFAAARKRVRDLQYDPMARVLYREERGLVKHSGIAVICAGTSDLPVAEEAARTLEVMGFEPARVRDVGVAGLHRLLHHLPSLLEARVIVAVAGMEGALPSVLAGLVAAPVVAVPTSVGYGAAFGGLAALLAMLNSCASGISVVNIDNGFGAAYMAAAIMKQILAQPPRVLRS